MAIDEIDICHMRYELNIYTRLCEILNMYIWGVEGYGERWGRGERERRLCGRWRWLWSSITQYLIWIIEYIIYKIDK